MNVEIMMNAEIINHGDGIASFEMSACGLKSVAEEIMVDLELKYDFPFRSVEIIETNGKILWSV